MDEQEDTRQPPPSVSNKSNGEREQVATSMPPTTTTTRLERLLAMEDALHGVTKNATLGTSSSSNSTHNSRHGNTTTTCTMMMMMMRPPHSVWREKVTQWCYNVVDHLDECRSVVYVAMHILDRFTAIVNNNNSCSTTSIFMNERCFELASMSALFLAIRIAGSGNLQLSQLVSMTTSSSGIQSKHIVAMGTRIIQSLGNDFWRVRCVTPLDFVQTLLLTLSSTLSTEKMMLSTEDQQEVLNTASFLCEIAVCDAPLALAERPSHIALAALLNALDAHYHQDADGDSSSSSFLVKAMMERYIKAAIPHDSQSLMRLRLRLQAVYGQTLDSSNSSSSQPSGAAGVTCPHVVLDHPQDEFSSPCQHKVQHSVSNDSLCNNTKNINNKRPLDHEDHAVVLLMTSPSRKAKRSMRKHDNLPSLIHPDE
jgi:Cyclin, N-terminal domain